MACALRSEDGTICPAAYECTAVPGSTQAVCCPRAEDELMAESSEDYTQTETRPQTSKLISPLNKVFKLNICRFMNIFSEAFIFLN